METLVLSFHCKGPGVPVKLLEITSGSRSSLYCLLHIVQPVCQAHDHRRAYLFRQQECAPHRIICCLRARGVKHRHFCQQAVVPGILFVLALLHARVVTCQYHQAGPYGVGSRSDERIGEYVHSYMLDCDK